MLDHVSIGVRDLVRTRAFYDAAFKPLGYKRRDSADTYLGYGGSETQFWIYQSAAPVKPDPGNGLHFSFVAPSRAAIDKFHAAALKAGGRDNGAPGERPDYGAGYYAAFVIDPDGYRIEAHHQA